MSMIAKQKGKFWAPGHPYYPYISNEEEKIEKRHEKTLKRYHRRLNHARTFLDKMTALFALEGYMSRKTKNHHWTGKPYVVVSEKILSSMFSIKMEYPEKLGKPNLEEPVKVNKLEYANTTTINMGI